MRRPVRIMRDQTEALRAMLPTWDVHVPYGWKIYVTNTKCGRCSYKNKNITVPLWAFDQEPRDADIHENHPAYAVYYAAHEISHAIAGQLPGAPHGPQFMKIFMMMCPDELQFFELGYKPRNAAAAGIRRKEA